MNNSNNVYREAVESAAKIKASDDIQGARRERV